MDPTAVRRTPSFGESNRRRRLCQGFDLQGPAIDRADAHRSETFKLSTDPLFVAKVRDIVDLYMAAPEGAVVLCVDEKSQIKALDRTQPLLSMRPGQAERRSHDYTRHGTLLLFAALDAATGKIIGRCFARHRAREFRAFLNTVESNVPGDLDVHLIIDNVSSRKTQAIRNWFAKRPRWQVHYTSTSASWLNQVERFFAKLTRRRLKRGIFKSIVDLQTAINRYLVENNDDPKPSCWTAHPDRILAAFKREQEVLD